MKPRLNLLRFKVKWVIRCYSSTNLNKLIKKKKIGSRLDFCLLFGSWALNTSSILNPFKWNEHLLNFDLNLISNQFKIWFENWSTYDQNNSSHLIFSNSSSKETFEAINSRKVAKLLLTFL
jgi:hypothetical protein